MDELFYLSLDCCRFDRRVFSVNVDQFFYLAFLIYGLSLILGSLISGFCLDKISVKLIIAIGLFATGFSLLGYLLTDAQVLHFFHGLASGLLLPAPFVYLAKLKQDTTKHRLILFSCLSIALALIVESVLGLMIEPKFSQNYVFVPAVFPTIFTGLFISALVLTLCSAYLFASIKLNQGVSR